MMHFDLLVLIRYDDCERSGAYTTVVLGNMPSTTRSTLVVMIMMLLLLLLLLLLVLVVATSLADHLDHRPSRYIAYM